MAFLLSRLEVNEHEFQTWVLSQLGVQQFQLRETRAGKWRQAPLNLYLGDRGSMWWRANVGGGKGFGIVVGCPGMHDVLGVVDGRAVGLELKAGRGKQSEEQIRWEEQWRKAGGRSYLIVNEITLESVMRVIGIKPAELPALQQAWLPPKPAKSGKKA